MNLRELELKFQLNLLQQTKLGKCIKKLIYLQSLKLTSLNDTSEAGDLRLFPLFDLENLYRIRLSGIMENLFFTCQNILSGVLGDPSSYRFTLEQPQSLT